MTSAEVAGVLGGSTAEVAALAARARAEVRAGREAALGRREVRSDCRFTVANLETFADATLDPAKGVLVRSHLDLCAPCRMRLGELANAPAALAAAVPAAPFLGGEAQRHWLTSAGDIRPAERLLPPGPAAVAPAHRLPDVLRRAGRAATGWFPSADSIDLTTSSAASTESSDDAGTRTAFPTADPPPRSGRVAVALRRAGRTIWPAVPATVLVVAWLAVMTVLPQLMSPDADRGPGEVALPAVQAYRPDYLPGAVGPAPPARLVRPSPGGAATVGAGIGPAPSSGGPGDRRPAGLPRAASSVQLIPATVRPSGPASATGAEPAPPGGSAPGIVPATPGPAAAPAAVAPVGDGAPAMGTESKAGTRREATEPGKATEAAKPGKAGGSGKAGRSTKAGDELRRRKPAKPEPGAKARREAGPGRARLLRGGGVTA